MFPNHSSYGHQIRKNKQTYFICRMQKKRAFRKLKSEREDFYVKMIAFNALKSHKFNKKSIRRDRLYTKLYWRFTNLGLTFPVSIVRWIYDQ